MKMNVRLVTLLGAGHLLFLSGCLAAKNECTGSCLSDSGVAGEDSGVAGEKDAGNAEVDAGQMIVPPIKGTGAIIWEAAQGDIRRPTDFSRLTIEALIPSKDGYVVKTGTGNAQGEFSIEGVPDGEFLLRTHDLRFEELPPVYIVTDRRQLDLSVRYRGRPDAGLAAVDPTSLALDVSGLEAASDAGVTITSRNAGLYAQRVIPPLVTSSYVEFNLFGEEYGVPTDPSFKDDLIVSQHANFVLYPRATLDAGLVLDTELTGWSLVREAAFAAPKMTAGQSVRMTAQLSALTEVQAPFYWSSAPFENLREQISAGSKPNGVGIDFIAWSKNTGEFVSTIARYSSQALVNSNYSLLLHQPSGTTVTHRVNHYWSRPVQLPGSEVPATLHSWVESDIELGKPIVPVVGPPLMVEIDGQDASKDVTVSQQPVVKWKPPAVGVPKQYEVRFYRLFVNSRRETVRSLEFDATLMTPHTEIRVPPGVLSSGKTYYMRVIAEDFSNVSGAIAPFADRRPPGGEARFTGGIVTVR